MYDPVPTVQAQIDKAVREALTEERNRAAKHFQRTVDAQVGHDKCLLEIGRQVLVALQQKRVPVKTNLDNQAVAKLCARYAAMGKDFDTLMEAVKADVMLTSEWERFAMMLRMSQED